MEYAEDDIARAGEYVLHLLSPEARRGFEARMRQEQALRRLVAEWEIGLAPLAEDIAETPAPPWLKGRIEDRLFPAIEPKKEPFWSSWPGIGIGISSIAAIFALAVVLTEPHLPSFDQMAATHQAELVREGSPIIAQARFSVEDGSLQITRLEGTAPPGRVLQLWMIDDQMTGPASLGLLAEDAIETVVIVPEDLRDNLVSGTGLLEISEEPPGGSPIGRPTGAVLAIGQVESL